MYIIKISFLVAWIITISAIVGIMHSWHLADLSPVDKKSLTIKDYSSDVKNFGIIHFLTPACSCSQSIYEELISRPPYKEDWAKEAVVLIDDSKNVMKPHLLSKGYKVISLSSKSIDKNNKGSIRGVPLLVIYDKKKVTRYVGGYSAQAITPFTDINIESFLKKIESGAEVDSLPVIGCAVSKEYKKLLDPFGLKYTEKVNEHI